MNGHILQSGKGTNLLLNAYLYRRDKQFVAKQHWHCTVRGCGAREHADYADPPVTLKESAHSHPPDDELACSKKTEDTNVQDGERETSDAADAGQFSYFDYIHLINIIIVI